MHYDVDTIKLQVLNSMCIPHRMFLVKQQYAERSRFGCPLFSAFALMRLYTDVGCVTNMGAYQESEYFQCIYEGRN